MSEDDDRFCAKFPFWFVADKDLPDDVEVIADRLKTVPTDTVPCPVAFTDYDAAIQFIEDERDERKRQAFAFSDIGDFVEFLFVLREKGVDGLAFDPYGGRFRWIKIDEVVEAAQDIPPQ